MVIEGFSEGTMLAVQSSVPSAMHDAALNYVDCWDDEGLRTQLFLGVHHDLPDTRPPPTGTAGGKQLPLQLAINCIVLREAVAGSRFETSWTGIS